MQIPSLVAGVLFVASAQAQATDHRAASPVKDLDRVAAEVRQKSELPVAVPRTFPVLEKGTVLHPTVVFARPGAYDINLGYAPDCAGGNACSYGHLAGKRGGQRSAAGAKRTELVGGIRAFVVPSRCGATCSDTEIVWIKDGVQYTIGVKAGAPSDVIRMANSALGGR